MKSSSLLVAILLLPMTSCVMRNHTFADRNGAPDVHALEKARQEQLAKSDAGVLTDGSWYPALALNMEFYNVSRPPLPSGTTYSDIDAFGPLFMFIDVDTCYYDETQTLYERKIDQSYLWGLFRYGRVDVRVPYGWRYDEEASVMFGLLRWPSTVYLDDKIDG